MNQQQKRKDFTIRHKPIKSLQLGKERIPPIKTPSQRVSMQDWLHDDYVDSRNHASKLNKRASTEPSDMGYMNPLTKELNSEIALAFDALDLIKQNARTSVTRRS